MNTIILIVGIVVLGAGRMIYDDSPRYAGRISGLLLSLAGLVISVIGSVGVINDGTVSYWLIRAMGYGH